MDLLRRDRVEEPGSGPGLGIDDSSVLVRSFGPEPREVDPRVPGTKASAPDDIGDIETTAVIESGLSTLDARDPRYSFHAHFCEVFRLDSEQGLSAGNHLGARLPSDWRARGEDSVEDDASDERHENAGHELAQQRVRYFRYVWPAAESAIYREAKRLASMGLIKGKKEYTGKRARTVYSITEDDRNLLREWLGTPISPFSMEFEAMLRVFVAPLGTKDELVGTLKQVRADAQEMLRFGGEVKQEFIDGINVTQDQVHIRALAVDFFISLLNTVEAWAERTLAEIETWDDLAATEEKKKKGT